MAQNEFCVENEKEKKMFTPSCEQREITCKNRYFFIEHIHHKKSKDYGSVCVESFRSPSGTDSWHHRNGYQHAPKAIEAFIFSKEDGQIARITHLF